MVSRPQRRTLRRAAAVLSLAAALLPIAAAAARPMQLEDLLQRESFGAVSLAPGGRWLLVEQRRPYAEGARFDFDRFNALFRTRLMLADLHGDHGLQPLFPAEPGVGYAAGPISPDGSQAVVYRLAGDRWELGIARFATRTVGWLGVTPEIPDQTRTVQWIAPGRLVAILLPQPGLPYALRAARPQPAITARWAAQARGEAAVTAVGAGRYAAVTGVGAPKRLAEIDVDSGAVETLSLGDFTDLEAAPSGHRLAVVEAGAEIGARTDRPLQGDYGIAVRRMRLRILDLRNDRLSAPCATCDLISTLLSWSPHGDRLLTYVRNDGAPWSAGRLAVWSPASDALAPIATPVRPRISGRPERLAAGWAEGDLVLFGRRPGDPRDDWFRLTGARPVRLTGDLPAPSARGATVVGDRLVAAAEGALWGLDRNGRARRLAAATPLPSRFEGFPDRPLMALPAARQLAAASPAETPGGPAALLLDAHGRVRRRLPLRPGETPLAITADGVLADDRGDGAETLVWRAADGQARRLAQINLRFRDIDRPPPLAVRHAGPDGQPLLSWLFLPPRPPGAPAPPLVVIPYPGQVHPRPPTEVWDAVPMVPTATLVGHGFAVLIPSLPAPAQNTGPADHLADRVLAIVDAAARQPDLTGRFDATRLGLWGHSFGGFATAAILTQTDRFAAAVAVAAPADLSSFWGQFQASTRAWPEGGVSSPWTAGWTESLQGDMGAPPWADPDRYLANSPLFHADRIRTPLLLAYGDQDEPHPGQAEALFSALWRQDKDVQLLTYWGEGHIFQSPGALRDLYGRGLRFLDAAFAPDRRVARTRRPPSQTPQSRPRGRSR